MSGIERIAAERKRQIEKEGWTPEHDDQHDNHEMALAAVCYASPYPVRVKAKIFTGKGEFFPEVAERWIEAWPWDDEWDKRQKHDRIRQLEIAGALIAAEIDRLERLTAQKEK